MSLPKTLLTLGVGTALALVVLYFSLNNLPVNRIAAACSPLSDVGVIDPSETVAYFQNRPVTPLLSYEPTLSEKDQQVLGVSAGDKWIEIDLSDQRLTAHQGDTIFLESLISSGLWNKTPPGEYRIWYKIRSTKMSGGVRGHSSYYYLPNVPFAMFFFGDYGIHGTYWHNNFGNPMSHGCVNAPTSIAEKLFYWSDPQLPPGINAMRSSESVPGTTVIVHD